MKPSLQRLLEVFWQILLLGVFPFLLQGQSTIIIEKYPDYTPSQDALYLTGSFNDWAPQDSQYRFQPSPDGYILRLNIPIPKAEFKVTRGSWKSVEGSKLGQPISNRLLDSNSDTLRISIESWEDLSHLIPYQKKVLVKVHSIPPSTPADASLYISGDFNEWNPGDKNFKLTKNDQGIYQVLIPIRADSVSYKFTRGQWTSVEGARSGRARSNRLYVDSRDKGASIFADIETWEDLSGTPITIYTFLLLLAACQGILLILAINTIQENNVSANRILSLLLLLISLALIARVSIYSRDIFQWQPKLILIPDLIYFLYGPVFLWYIRSLLTLPNPQVSGRFGPWIYFIPAIIHLVAYLPLFLMDAETFTSRVVDMSLKKYFILAAVLAWAFSLFYWYQCYRILRVYEVNSNNNHSFEQNMHYLQTVMQLKWLCLLVWGMTYLIGVLGIVLNRDWTWWTDKSTDTIWILFSFTVFFLGYFAIKQPEIFRLAEEATSEAIPDKKTSDSEDIPQELKEQLQSLMELEKPFLNPQLTLSDLADLLGTNIHLLSKLINEGFDKNFYDFINTYRVREFKRRVVLPEYRNQTFLSVAFSVGFNSKTAFNRSFKKLTQSTPRQYLKNFKDSKGQASISV